MGACTVTAATAFAATVGSDGRPVGYASLPTLSASILVLLALSSRSARQYATRTRRLDVPGGQVHDSRLIGGWPPRAEWRRPVL